MYRLLIFCFFISFFTAAVLPAQGNWEYKKEKDGIKIYTRDIENSNIKELRITLEVEADMSAVVALICDVSAYKKWVYKCSESKTLRQISSTESIDYYIADFPWPMTDRDMVTYSVIKQDPETGIVTSRTESRSGELAIKEDFVRVTKHVNTWAFKEIGNGKIAVDYTLNTSPAGSIPTWLVNLVIDQGPLQSMQEFRKLLKDQKYQSAQLADYF